MRKIKIPINDIDLKKLKSGDKLLLSGYLYTARDAALKRLTNIIENNEELPFDLVGQCIAFVSSTPKKEGEIVGSLGPTSSYRMDKYMEKLVDCKVNVTIGKGKRSGDVVRLLRGNNYLYFGMVGGLSALFNKCVVSSELICFDDLESEAIYRYKVIDLPVVVIIDSMGGYLYEE